jgi:hypothetical protein
LIHWLAEGGYGGETITPGIARNATFAASITVDCRVHHCQNEWDLMEEKSSTYIKNEVRPFGN